MFRKSFAATALAAALAVPTFAAADDPGVEVGTLTCEQHDRVNLVVWSDATFVCTLRSETSDDKVYEGRISKVGADLTVDKIETMAWTVFAPTLDMEDDVLVGEYVGASADAAVGSGGGARVLVGGFENSINLQPVALSGETGFGVAAGIENFTIKMPD